MYRNNTVSKREMEIMALIDFLHQVRNGTTDEVRKSADHLKKIAHVWLLKHSYVKEQTRNDYVRIALARVCPDSK